jgi:hypothetical protein
MMINRKIGFLIILLFLTFLLLGIPLPAQEAKQDRSYSLTVAKEGEVCMVCGETLTDDDVALLVRGRRVPLKREMLDAFLKNQEKFFAQLQPKSALFQENLDVPEGVAQGGISSGVFFIGLYVLIALIFGGLSGYTAISKGLPVLPHFFIGLVFAIFGYIYVLFRPASQEIGDVPKGLVKIPNTAVPLPCPNCGQPNHPSAKQCCGCQGRLKPKYGSEVVRALK